MTRDAPARSRTISHAQRTGTEEIVGAKIAWSVSGRGPVVVWCHGLGSSSHGQEHAGLFDWSTIEDSFALLRYDARGHGASTGGVDPDEYRWERLADDLLELLDRVAPGERVHGIGSSMGSATLVLAAIKEPSRFRSLVLTAPSTLHFTRPAQRGFYLDLAHLREREGHDEFLRRRAGAAPAKIFGQSPVALEWEVAEELTAAGLRGAGQSDYPKPEVLGTLRVPTLVLAWATDAAHPLSAAGILADALPMSYLEVANTLTEVQNWPHLACQFLTEFTTPSDLSEP